MADFAPIYERMLRDEGGYQLTDIAGDRGGQTYAGIARNAHPGWPGWAAIDRGEQPPAELVRGLYRAKFWDPLRGDEIADPGIAETLFNFGVNAGPATAVKLAQIVVGATPDGALGPRTLAALNASEPALFRARYALAKIGRYAEIVNRDRSQARFLLGWINRTLEYA